MREVPLEPEPEGRRPLPDLERRERVHVDLRDFRLDRAHDARVVVAGERGMDPALEADLGRAALPRLRARRTISSSGTRYGAPRRFRASLPFENAQKPQRK